MKKRIGAVAARACVGWGLAVGMAVGVGAGLGGCVRSDFVVVGERSYAPRERSHVVDVYLPVDAPVVVHKQVEDARALGELPASEVIGRIDVEGDPRAGWGAVFAEARHRARRLGGDAIVVRAWDRPLAKVTGRGKARYGKSVVLEVHRYE